MMTRGIRCEKCKKEVSHVVDARAPLEAVMVDQETWLAIEHRKECGGVVSVFHEEVSE